MVHMEHTHTILTLLGLLALLLLAVSVAGAGGWQEGDGVRYTTYRSPPPAYQPVPPGATMMASPVVWVTPQGWATHLAIRLESASAIGAGWIVTPLVVGVEPPSCTAEGKKHDRE